MDQKEKIDETPATVLKEEDKNEPKMINLREKDPDKSIQEH